MDRIRDRLAVLYPEVETTGFGVTGRVLRLARAFEARRAEHLGSLGLNCGEFDVLATIRRISGSDGVNPADVLRSVLITSGGLTKRLDRLESAGLIERRPDPDDRRGTRVRLTSAGQELIDRALPSLLTMEHESLSAELSERQLEQTASLLRRLSALTER